MKATIIKALEKIFIKSDYNREFVSELKKEIPPEKRRWNSAFSMGLFYRLMTGIPEEKLKEPSFLEEIKGIWESGILKKTWEVDKEYYSKVKDLCLKHYLEVYEDEKGNSVRIFASEGIDYEKINMYQEKLLKEAAKYRSGKIVAFRWDFTAESSPETGRDNINFQFYSPEGEEWFYATYFSHGPKEEICPEVSSRKEHFKVTHSEEGYSYTWEGKFFCPQNTLFKFLNSFYLVIDENRVGLLGDGVEGWSMANQIIEYQKILLNLDEIITEREKIEDFLKSKPLEIIDIEFTFSEELPSNSIEIIEKHLSNENH